MLNLKDVITDNVEIITLESITTELKGIILVFIEDRVVGYIQYDGYKWLFCNSIRGYLKSNESLDSLIDLIRENYKGFFNFKVLQFSLLDETRRC